MFQYVAPAPVFEYIAPEPAVSFVAPNQQLRPAHTASGVNLHAAVEVSASQVVGSLPLGEVFAAPVFHHVHHEQRAGGDTTEIFANFPVVQEQGVVGSHPPVEEFTVYVARRPSPLVEVWPSVRVQRHVVEQLADIAPMVQILDSPEPQMVAQLLEVFRLLDTQLLDEQAILVPKISCSPCPSRSRVPEPQSAEQLVEVPTVLTPTRIALQIAEQIVDTPLEDSSDELLDPPECFGTVLVASGDMGPGVIRADDGMLFRFQSPSWFLIPVGARVAFRAEYGLDVNAAYGVYCWYD